MKIYLWFSYGRGLRKACHVAFWGFKNLLWRDQQGMHTTCHQLLGHRFGLTHKCALLIPSCLSPIVKCSFFQPPMHLVIQLHIERFCFSDKRRKCCHCDLLLSSSFIVSGVMLGAPAAFLGSHLAVIRKGQKHCIAVSPDITSLNWWINTINCLIPAFMVYKKYRPLFVEVTFSKIFATWIHC